MPTLQEHEDPNSEGSPPGLAPERQGGPVSTSAAGLQLPRETVTKLRGTLSHPSEFWVTSVENYEANGVLFKGNLRAKDVQKAYASTASRLKVCLLCHAVHGTTVTSGFLLLVPRSPASARLCAVHGHCITQQRGNQQCASQVDALASARLWHPADGLYAVYGSCTACSPLMRRLCVEK